jgi:SAM-dependent MidA family methyltransferase
MEACLYHPQYGYYVKPDQPSRRDYFTSVDLSPLFGHLLTRQFAEMWNVLGRPDPFYLIEAGAGTGALAKDILEFTRDTFPDLYAAARYVAVERSAVRRAGHALCLSSHMERGRFASSDQIPRQVPVGCIFSNELLDAFSVHRVVRQGSGLREQYVGVRGQDLCEELGALSSPRIAEYFGEQGITLHDGQHAEAGVAACDWIREAGAQLKRGFVLTVDYGHEARELYDERHMRGTLLAYERHRASEDFYRAPGEQDLTAHVNFTALDVWGRRSGLVRAGLVTQSNFLLAIARKSNLADLELAGAGESERARARLLFKTLIHPEGMGETFQVMVQQKGIESARLSGLEPI